MVHQITPKTEQNTKVLVCISKRDDYVKPTSVKSLHASFQQLRPIHNALISCPDSPSVPLHIVQLNDNQHRSDWLTAIYEGYDKMHGSHSLSAPMLRKHL